MLAYQVEIDKPVSEVYRIFKDPELLPRWLKGLQRVEQISGTPGEVGSKTRQVYLERGRIVELIETITAHDPEKHFAGTLEAPGMHATLDVDFEDRGERTIIRFRSGFRGTSLVMKLMLPFFRRGILKRQAGDLERFKELVERGELQPVRGDGPGPT